MQFSSKLAFSLAAAPGNKTKKDKRALWKAFSLHKKNKCFPALFYRACVRYLILFTWVTNHHGFVLSRPVPAAGLQAFSHCREVLSHSSGMVLFVSRPAVLTVLHQPPLTPKPSLPFLHLPTAATAMLKF